MYHFSSGWALQNKMLSFSIPTERNVTLAACDWTVTAQKNRIRHIVTFRRQNYSSAKMTE